MMTQFFKKYVHLIILFLFGLIFFHIYTFLYHDLSLFNPNHPEEQSWLIFNQPDESANYFFIRQLVFDHQFVYSEALSFLTENQVHPRSTTIIHGNLTPIGFPGIIFLAGVLIKIIAGILGNTAAHLSIVLFTPLIAVITPLFLYGIGRHVFSERIAFLSSVFLFILPPWWYYNASRPLQHNTLFIFLLLVGLYFFTLWAVRQKSHLWFIFFATFFTGMAAYVRPTESVWIGALFVGLLMLYRRKFNRKIWFALVCAVLSIGILFTMTQTLYYGHPLGSGYVRPAAEGSSGLITDGPQGRSLIEALFLPFGFHSKQILKNGYEYFVQFLWPWFLIAFVGFLMQRKVVDEGEKRSWYIYSIGYACVGMYLLLYYGSWDLDNIFAPPASIGSSHVRYFLPVYIGMLPFVAFVLTWLWEKRNIYTIFAACMLISLSYISVQRVFMGSEGLIQMKQTLHTYSERREEIDQRTQKNAVIVTRYADKYVFPIRKVIPGLTDPSRLYAVQALLERGYPVYWYDTTLSKNTIEYAILSEYNLELSEPIAQWDGLVLHQIQLKQGEQAKSTLEAVEKLE